MIPIIIFFLILLIGWGIFYKLKKYLPKHDILLATKEEITPILKVVFGETEFYDKGNCYGLWVDDTLIGCVCKSDINEGGVNGPYIYNLAVLPIYRNRGFGTQLLNHVKEPGVWLTCEKNNLDWYLRHQFKIVNTFQNEFILRL